MELRGIRMGVAAVLLATLGVACGGSSSDDDAPATSPTTSVPAVVTTVSPIVTLPTVTPTTSAASAGTGACKYVTTAQASTLATSPVKAGVARTLSSPPVTFDYCDYIFDPGNAPGVTVAVADLGTSGASLFAAFKASKASENDHQVVSGVGDEAFFSGQNLNVRKGNKGLILFVGRATGSPRGVGALADEKRLAELVLPQL
jgi:hypothetical protein